jgi:DNA-binding transcriptional MerR regulator/methylmalonyl-CoA mutase cobalamin-binding subunit
MKIKNLHPIRYASRNSGVKTHLIRVWESRYGAVQPKRTEGNQRLFSDEDIERLRLLGKVVESGHNISTVARLSNQELAKIAGDAGIAGEKRRADRALETIAERGWDDPDKLNDVIDAAFELTIRLDTAALEELLANATVMLPRHHFLQRVLLPMLNRIGDLWASGELRVVHEHAFSTVVRALLWEMLKTVDVPNTAPKMVVTTPVGHWHECGALIAAVAALESGWQVRYLGPCLPAEEIAYAVKKLDARALSISIGHGVNDRRLAAELTKTRRYIGGGIPIFVGGQGADAIQNEIANVNAIVVSDLRQFRDQLEGLFRHDPSEYSELEYGSQI